MPLAVHCRRVLLGCDDKIAAVLVIVFFTSSFPIFDHSCQIGAVVDDECRVLISLQDGGASQLLCEIRVALSRFTVLLRHCHHHFLAFHDCIGGCSSGEALLAVLGLPCWMMIFGVFHDV